MTPIGESLRRARLKRGLQLDEISRELKISARFLEAIEDEDFNKLPAGVFAKSFVRQYARYLELDEEEIASQYQRTVEPEPLPVPEFAENSKPNVPEIHLPRVEAWETVGDRRSMQWSSWLPSLALVIVVMLVCSGVYSFWQRSRHSVAAQATTPPPMQTAQVPAQQSPAQTQPEPVAAAGVPTEPSQQPAAAAPPAQAPTTQVAEQKPPTATPANPPVVEAVNTAARSADAPPNTPAIPTGNAAVRIELTAAEPVWVLVRADGKYVFSGTIEANQTRSLEATGLLMLRVGNAGGVTITQNGKPIGPIGPKGQVRTVQFTSGGFQIVAAPKPALPPAELL